MWKATAVLRGERSLLRKSNLTTLDKLYSKSPIVCPPSEHGRPYLRNPQTVQEPSSGFASLVL